jgi:ribosomal-protein-alanine N-acetyltransferase
MLAFLDWEWYNPSKNAALARNSRWAFARLRKNLRPGEAEMIVRPAGLPDLNACLALDHGFLTGHVWQMAVQEADSGFTMTFQTVRLPRKMQVQYPRDVEQLVEDWQRAEGFLVAEVDGEIRGYVDLVTQRWQQLGWVTNLAVDRDYRRQGIGTALVQNARQWAWDEGLQTLQVETTTKNYPALSFYQKLGFKFCGFNDHYYTNQDIAVFLVQTLR